MTSFRDLHVSGQPFILANVWDAGSARMMSALGAQALASSSAAHAFTLGRKDMGTLSRDEALGHARDIMAATPLPVSGDFENGFAQNLEGVAETIFQSISAGLEGCGIEDTHLPSAQSYSFDESVQRVAAAVKANAACEQDFVLTARADGVMLGNYDLEEGIDRLQAFAEVGADVLYIPMPESMQDLEKICSSVDKPVNALCAGQFTQYSVQNFADIGVARISLGSSLARAVHTVMKALGHEMFEHGIFSGMTNNVSGDVIDKLLEQGT